MPYKSEAQRKFFNVNRKKLEAQGVDVDEWNQASKGKKLPEKKANTPGQTGNIPVTPPTAVRPEAAPSAYIPRPARRQTTLADMQGKQAMSTQKVDTPFFYLLGDLAKAAAATTYTKQAFVAWGGGSLGLHPEGRGIGGELGYTNLLGVLPMPLAGIDIGGPQKGFSMGVTPSDDSDFGVSPYVGIRWNHPRKSGITRNFPRGLPEVIYDLLRGRTKLDAMRASYPELFEDDEADKAHEAKAETKVKSANVDRFAPGVNINDVAMGRAPFALQNPLLTHPQSELKPFKGGPMRRGLGVPMTPADRAGLTEHAAPGTFDASLSKLTSSLGDFATSPLGIGALGLGALGTGMYLGGRRKRDDDEKEAGVGSEYAGLIANPLNYIGPGHLGALAAAITPTRSLKDQVSADDEMWSNLLIPGRASYNMFKRVGSSLRSPEMLEKQREHLRKKKQQELAESAEEAGVKAAAGSTSEMLSAFNPLNIYGGAMLGGGAALMSPTRSLEEQAAHDAARGPLGYAADILIPGVGAYNGFKRLGSMVRSPEIKKMKAQKRYDKLKKETDSSDETDKEASVKRLAKAAAKSVIKAAEDPTTTDKLMHYAGIPAALLGAGALSGAGVGALAHPLQELFSTDTDPEARKRRQRERLLTGAGVGTGVGLAQTLRHLSSPIGSY